MTTRNPKVDEAFLRLEHGLRMLGDASGSDVKEPYFREVCASTRILRMDDVELTVTITVSPKRPRQGPSGRGGMSLM